MSQRATTQDGSEQEPRMVDTEWFNELMTGIYGPRKGGARIIIDAENAATGAGKTGLAVHLAETLSHIFGYEMSGDDMTLSGAHYLQRWQEHPGREQPSVLILDELAGAGAGHSRRGMSKQNVQLGKSWQLMRKKRVVTIVTLPHWRKADKDLRQQADYRLWCREEPIGTFKPYRITTGFEDGQIKTRGYDDISRISFPNLDAKDDRLFRIVDKKKDELLASGTLDADEVGGPDGEEVDIEAMERGHQQELAQVMREPAKSIREVADDDRVEYKKTWVEENTETPTDND